MGYLAELSALSLGPKLALTGTILATSIVGAFSQRRWPRGGPALVAALIAVAATAAWAGFARASAGPWTLLLFAVAVPNACACAALAALRRRRAVVRMSAGVVAGAAAALLSPLAALVMACGVLGDCL
jgi:hypothetical protein